LRSDWLIGAIVAMSTAMHNDTGLLMMLAMKMYILAMGKKYAQK